MVFILPWTAQIPVFVIGCTRMRHFTDVPYKQRHSFVVFQRGDGFIVCYIHKRLSINFQNLITNLQ